SIPLFSSFEALCVRLTVASSSYTILTIYRPPSSSKALFSTEFSTLLKYLISSPSELIITGAFNFHLDNVNSPHATPFLTLLSSLYTAPLSSLNAYILQFSSTLSLLLDKHAPLKTITCPSQQRKPFITDDILKEKAKRSKLETIYRRNKTPANKANFKNQARFL